MPGVSRLLAPNPSPMTLTGTNTYLVGEANLLVVDPGPDLPEHIEAIVALAQTLGRLAYSVVTHHHGDHLPAALRLRDRLGAPIVGHPTLPGVDRPCADGNTVTAGQTTLRAVATPGHTSDHMCFFLEEEKALFTGDLIAGQGTVIVGDGPGDLADYMDSLRRVASLHARLLLPGHGPVVANAASKIREYLDHRALREGQVVSALSDGPATARALVERLYADTPRVLHAMAERNVRAHLFKLAHEGRVSEHGRGWQLNDGREAR